MVPQETCTKKLEPRAWEVKQMDVKSAFLYANFEQEVFVAEPPGFETIDKD